MKAQGWLLSITLIALLLAGWAPTPSPVATASPVTTPSPVATASPAVMLEPEGFIRTIHAPVMTREGDTYYVFSTGGRVFEKTPTRAG